MVSKLVPITLTSAVGLGIGVAAVADTAVGTIAQVSETCDALTLDDGSSFSFDDEAYADRLNCFKPGDEVSVTWRNVGEKMEAMTISPVSATLGERGVGTIATINAVGDTVTLSDGTTYVFEDGAFADRLHCFTKTIEEYDVVCAEAAYEIGLLLRGDHRNRLGAESLGNLDSGCADTPGSAMDEHGLPGFGLGPQTQDELGGHVVHRDCCGLLEAHIVGQFEDRFDSRSHHFSRSAIARAGRHPVAHR